MVLGMPLATFTALHVALSLIGLLAGYIMLFGMIAGRPTGFTTPVFLATTIVTSATGCLFPVTQLLPSHIVGIISLVVLAVAVIALWLRRLEGPWRWVYVVTATTALYLNTFVAVVQAFLKLPVLQPLAPTQSEPPFAVVQGLVLVALIGLGYVAVRKFRPVTPA